MPLSLSLWWVGLLSYFAAHLAHLTLWRIGKNYRLTDVFHLLISIPTLFYLNFQLKTHALDLVVPFVIHAILAANYLAAFPAFQASSPTIQILVYLRQMGRPISREVLIERFGEKGVVENRISDLISGGMISEKTHQLSKPANWLASFFIWYRRLLGLPVGGG